MYSMKELHPKFTQFVFHLSISDYLSTLLSAANSSCTSSLEIADSNVLYKPSSLQIFIGFWCMFRPVCGIPLEERIRRVVSFANHWLM